MLNTDTGLIHHILYPVATTIAGLFLFYIIFYLLKRWSKKKQIYVPKLIDKYLHLPGIVLFILITLNINIVNFEDELPPAVYHGIRHALFILLIIAVGYLILRVIGLIQSIIVTHFQNQERHDYRLRSVRTKYGLIQRALNIVIITITLTFVLMTFKPVRQLGGALLASAGVAGIVIGFAAQKSLGSLLAGIQIAISQPIKLDDTVVVEDTFGTVGEITFTYAVINTWDEKRLIVPISYFLEEPFENWTRSSPEVVGKVLIYADYTLPVDELRTQFEKWLDEIPLWDKRKKGLVITDATDKTIEVRATMSSKNADDAFDLECMIREKMITFIREKYPHALPSSRINIKGSENV